MDLANSTNNQKPSNDLNEKKLVNEIDFSKRAAQALMENWDSRRFDVSNSGSYTDAEGADEYNDDTVEETAGDESKFQDMSKDQLLDYIFDGDSENEMRTVLEEYSEEDLREIALEKLRAGEEEEAPVNSEEEAPVAEGAETAKPSNNKVGYKEIKTKKPGYKDAKTGNVPTGYKDLSNKKADLSEGAETAKPSNNKLGYKDLKKGNVKVGYKDLDKGNVKVGYKDLDGKAKDLSESKMPEGGMGYKKLKTKKMGYKSYKTRMGYKLLGLNEAIGELSSLPINEQSTFKVVLEKYKHLINAKKMPDAVLLEMFVHEMGQFDWDNSVEKVLEGLKEIIKDYSQEIEVEKAMFSLKRDAGWQFYSGASDLMREWLEDDNRSTKLLTRDLRKWAFNPKVGHLINRLNEMDSKTTGSLNLPSKQGESYVSKVYSPIYLAEGSTYFFLDGKYYQANDAGIFPVKNGEVNEKFQKLVESFNSDKIKITEEGITCYAGNGRVLLREGKENTEVLIGDKKINFANVNELGKLLETNFSSLFRAGSKLISDILRIYENFDSIVELDFAKSVRSRIYEGVSVNLIKWNNKIFVNKVNEGMKENAIYEANGGKAVRFVKEYLNYDISEGLTEYLEGENRTRSIMINDRNRIMENLKIVEGEVEKVNKAIASNPNLTNVSQIQEVKAQLEREAEILKEKWNQVNRELEGFDSIDFESLDSINEDSEFAIGDAVKIKESGDTGKVISIDGASGSFTVLLDNGKTGEFRIDEMTRVEETATKDEETEAEGKKKEDSEEENTQGEDNPEDSASAEEKD